MSLILRAMCTLDINAADLMNSQRMLRRLDALHRDTMTMPSRHVGLFVSGTPRKQLFH